MGARMPEARPSDSLLESLRVSIDSGGRWIERLPRWLVSIVVLGLILIRDGLHTFVPRFDTELASVQAFPKPLTYMSWSWGNLAVAKALRVDTTWQWLALHLVLVVIALVLPLVLLRRLPRGPYDLFAVAWGLLPVVGSVLMWVGMYDVMTLIGAELVALGGRWWLEAIGAVIMSSGNPEQAMVASLALLCLSAVSIMRTKRRAGMIALGVTVATYVLGKLLIVAPGVTSRSGYLRSPIAGVEIIIKDWPGSVWGWYGVLWIVVAGTFIALRGRDRLMLVVGLIVVPALATLVTYDWSRVFWFTSTTALLALLATLATRAQAGTLARGVLLGGLLLLVVSPPDNGGLFFLASTITGVLRGAFA